MLRLGRFASLEGAQNEQESGVRAHYAKYEYKIPMRDGKYLFTSVYAPKDASRPYPFLITRTPYSVAPYGPDAYRRSLGPSPEFQDAGYIFVYQDVRGRNMSEGTFVEMNPHIDHKKSSSEVDESSDMHDTVDWLLKNVPNNNGKVGIWGISYPGFYTSASIIDSHPAIRAASPEAPMTDLFMGDDSYHGGAFMLAANFGFYVFFKPQSVPTLPSPFPPFDYGTNDGYEFYRNMGPISNAETRYFKGTNPLWDDQANHDTYDDYWKIRNIAPHLHNIHCAVLTVGGWFDAEDLAGPFKVYAAVKKYDRGIFNALVVGPWVHGGWARYDGERLGDVTFGSNTAGFFRRQILFPFFEQYLKNGPDTGLPEAYVFETGSNAWRKYPSWPPPNRTERTLYLRENGGLSFDPPRPSANATTYDEYISDPNRPVPFVAYPATDVPQEYMDSDQRFAQTRPDVLVYQSQPLDADLTVAGPVSPRLFVSTSGTDSDFVVKLIDVYPDREQDLGDEHSGNDVGPPRVTMAGYEQLVRGEPMRGKFRRSFERPEPFTPGRIEEIDFTMPDINHTFRRGHRIMVQVQSSWFPLVDRNPQTFENIPDAKPEDFRKATERVYRTPTQSSGIVVDVLP
ncbi:MAG TPA: CocE/NonD family hydrolase [Candidatus Cybelea sp.]|nr:CocE/NonD family hydrolase [Candidatus Cybelea sp.]